MSRIGRLVGKIISAYRQYRIRTYEERRPGVAHKEIQAEREGLEAQNDAYRQQISRAVTEIAEQNREAAQQQQSYERRKAHRECSRFALDVLAILIAAAAAVFLFGQQNIMKGQLDEMRAERRPWVKSIDIKITKLEVAKDQVLIWGDFAFQNVGKSPAMAVSVHPELVIPELDGPFAVMTKGKEMCHYLEHTPKMVVGNALFPTDTGSIKQINFGRPLTDIEKARHKWLTKTKEGWAHSLGEKEAKVVTPSFEKTAAYTQFGISGCIAYKLQGSNEIHGTSFAVMLERASVHTDPVTGVSGASVNTSVPNVVDDIKVIPQLLGFNDAD